MRRKFQTGQLVRFTEYTKFGESDLFGYVMGYYGSRIGLRHYMIKGYNSDTEERIVYMRTTKYMKAVTKEEEFLLFLERK